VIEFALLLSFLREPRQYRPQPPPPVVASAPARVNPRISPERHLPAFSGGRVGPCLRKDRKALRAVCAQMAGKPLVGVRR